jgi:hypothetical protein
MSEIHYSPRLAWGKAQDPLRNQLTSKGAGQDSQMVAHLPIVHKALSSMLSIGQNMKFETKYYPEINY